MAKMKAYGSFDEYLEDQSVKNQEIIRALRTFVKRVEPGLREAVEWGNGCWIGTNGPVAYQSSRPVGNRSASVCGAPYTSCRLALDVNAL
jgi:hypothetical protein